MKFHQNPSETRINTEDHRPGFGYFGQQWYAIFFTFLFLGLPMGSDLTGMHSIMGAVFITFGFSICYLMSILPYWIPCDSQSRLMSRFWSSSTLLFAILLGDATLRIHENLGHYVFSQTVIFLIYGALLLIIVGVYRRSFHKPFWVFFLSFVFFSGIAVLSDSPLGHEAIFVIGGALRSQEQFCETFSVFLLSTGFISEAIQDFVLPVKSR